MTYFPKPGVADCSESPPLEEEAIILFPSLGTPLLLAPGQTKASIFIAAHPGMRSKAKADRLMEKAVDIYKLVDQHLRVVDIDSKNEDKETKDATTRGTLFEEDKEYALAKQHIRGWRVGEFVSGAVIYDRHKRPFATIAAPVGQLYPRMRDVYEIELDFSAPAFSRLQTLDSLVSLAWIVRLSAEDKNLKGFEKLQYAEAQDMAIARFLERQLAGDPHHFDKLYEFKLHEPGAKFDRRLPVQSSGLDALLKSWHPVKRMAVKQLKIGHLTDVHVNVRHNALAASPAKVLEDESQANWNQPVGTKVCNSFEALKSLFEKMAVGNDKADVVLLTGDLIDFNRNLNPEAGASSTTIGSQWRDFNLLTNIFDKKNGPRLYPRGVDDMLVFSLVREMYRKYKLPIIMTSGNHEAYQVPYGISARVEGGDMDNWSFKLGVLESTTSNNRAARQRMEGNSKQSWPDGNIHNEARRAKKRVAQPDAVERHLTKLEEASAWTRGKANEGMSRDHNLTIYEACLAYGPTYGQVLTGYNFSSDQFDWFYALFTPLADCVVAYGAESTDKAGAGSQQVIAALGWGFDENFMNVAGHFKNGVDRQGKGILPRAVESFSYDQMALLKQAQCYKHESHATLTVASHFTIVSFDEPEPYSTVIKNPARMNFVPSDSATSLPGRMAAFNQVNVGTCEKNLATYFEQCVTLGSQVAQGPAAIDWHLSGHSHRSGVYKLQWQPVRRGGATQQIQVVSAKDPGIHHPQIAKPHSETTLIVSSCGGPIGYQNLDGELSAWTGRSPAGTLLDPISGLIKQIKTDRCHLDGSHQGEGFNEKPRLAVALDYLHVMHGLPDKGGIHAPLRFKPEFFYRTGQLELALSSQMQALACIEAISFWVFEKIGTDPFAKKKWHNLKPNLNGTTLKFGPEDMALLWPLMQRSTISAYASAYVWSPKSMITNFPNTEQVVVNKSSIKAFCEVTLKKPSMTPADEDWSKDMLWTDPWVFPLEFTLIDGYVDMGGITRAKSNPSSISDSIWHVARPMGEKGEVPDWDWLYDNWGTNSSLALNKYPKRKNVIFDTD